MTIFLNSNTAGGIKMLEGSKKRGGGLDVPRGGGAQDTPEFLAHCILGVARYSGGNSGQGGPSIIFQNPVFLFQFDQLGLHCKVKRRNRSESLYIYIYLYIAFLDDQMMASTATAVHFSIRRDII